MMNKPENEKKPKGREVIAEAQALLGKLVVSGNRGGYLEGEHVAVLVDPMQDDEHDGLRLLVTCHAFGHRKVDWDDYGIRARGENERESPGVFVPLNVRGQALVESLSPGTYSLGLVSHQDLSGELAGTALDPRTPDKGRDGAVSTLRDLAKKPGKHARAVLASCLELLCDPSLPAAMRKLISQAFSTDSAVPLRDLDLTTCAAKLSQPLRMKEPEDAAREIELDLARALGFVLSARNLDRRDERELLAAIVSRSKEQEGAPVPGRAIPTLGWAEVVSRRVTAEKTRGPVRTRGAQKKPPMENPLIVLARTGGARVRKALVDLLSAELGNDALISELRGMSF